MAIDPDFRLDAPSLRQRFSRAAETYDNADMLAREISRRMEERLDYIRLTPRRILDVGCGTGSDLMRLSQRYPDASCFGADISRAMLMQARRRSTPKSSLLQRLTGRISTGLPLLTADGGALPIRHASISLVWSNLMLPALHDPLPALQEAHRVLETGGLLMFSSFGPDTLRELRSVLPTHAGERVHRFIDMHDIGDALVKAGFSDPVMDMEMLTLTYADLDTLFEDLRATGGNNAACSRPRGLSGRHGWLQAREAYEKLRQNGRLPVSVEVIQGHAWKATAKTVADGRAIMQFHPRSGSTPGKD